MAELHVTELLALLQRSGLLTTAQWGAAQNTARQFSQNIASSPAAGTSEAFAAELVKVGLLTQWQSGQLLKGQTGFVLEKYRLLAPVGKGGMGHVFKATDSNSDAIVAIKVMSRKLTGNQTLVSRFRREIRASSLLNSPNIVRTLDAGRVGKVDFMVMEFVNGDQLDRIISRINTIPVGIACEMIRQTAIGLQHAHEQKMVHRDIKPGNLIIDWSSDGKGTVKIMDMGLVRLSDDSEERTSVTRAGQVMGTPDYMSPEQGWNTATVDWRSDLYSLGCTFFRLITGRVPFPGDNPLQVLMARCSKDAPSAKLHRADIPDAIDGILRRMTLRDPNARFQSTAEVISALTPFCHELTQESLRKAMQDAGLEEPDFVLELADNVESDNQDAGYQQFLKEMDSGAAVDLMINTSGGQHQSLSSTIPALPQVDSQKTSQRIVTPRKDRTTRTIAMASGGAAIALIALFMVLNRDRVPDGKTKSDPDIAGQKTTVDIPVAKLKSADSFTIHGGQVIKIQPEFEGPVPNTPTHGNLKFRFGAGAPATATIDPVTGQVVWSVLPTQSPSEYFLPVEYVFSHDNSTTVVAQTKFVVIVESKMVQYSLPRPPPIKALTQQQIEFSMAATPPLAAGTDLNYRLGRGQLPGMSVHPKTGVFQWLPSDDDVGRHSVTVELYDVSVNDVAATSTVSFVIRPMSASLTLSTFAEQNAKAGELFEMKLSERPVPFYGRVLRLKVKEGAGAPDGVQIDPRSPILRWQVPKDASGRVEIHLQVELLLPDMELSPGAKADTSIVINVAPVVPATLLPTDAEIAVADKELRDLFKREIAQAKTPNDRAVLARELLDRTQGQARSASDYALLNLAAEFADRGRATDVALDVNQRRAERYQTDEFAVANQLMSEYRTTSGTSAQNDSIIEHGLRLASIAARTDKFTEIGVMLHSASLLLKKTDKGSFARQLADDIQQIIELADGLANDAGTATDLKKQELILILDRWQFKGLFTAKETFSYLQSVNPAEGLPDSGRSLWTLENDHIQLESKPAKGVLGIIETVREPSRYIIRMQISMQTTSAILILGASRDQNLNAHLITLDTTAFGQIATLPVAKTLVVGKPITTTQNGGWNEVEILVDGKSVSIRLNGQLVSTSQLTDLKPGRLGVLVSLERATPPPKLDIRRARILVIPDSP